MTSICREFKCHCKQWLGPELKFCGLLRMIEEIEDIGYGHIDECVTWMQDIKDAQASSFVDFDKEKATL